MSWLEDAKSDAKETAHNFLEEIVESYIDNGEASDDLNNDYAGGDSWHHESHVDKSYSLQEAAELLDELDDYEETDEGLWEGQKPRDAISTQAAYTYGNAVYGCWRDIIKEINDDPDLEELKEQYDGVEDAVREELEKAEEAFNESNQDEYDDFDPPFDEDEEVERRQAALKADIQKRIEAIID
jgi:hypothetical protein